MGHDVRQLVRKRVNNPQVPKPLVGRADGDPAQTFSRASRSHEGQEMLWGTRPSTPALPVSSPERSWGGIRVQPGAKGRETEMRKSGKGKREVFTRGLIIFFPLNV